MTRREDLLERLEETVFALMMEEVISVEGRKALEENERLKADKSFVVPEETYRKGLSTIKKHFSRNTRQATVRTMSKLISRVAVIALVLLLLFTTAFATIPKFRRETMNLLIEVFDDRTRIEFGDGQPKKSVNKDIGLVGWIPEDFALVDKGETEVSAWEKYKNHNGDFLEINIRFGENLAYEIDTEHAIVENIEISGRSAIVVFKEKAVQVAIPLAESRRIWYVQAEGVASDIVLAVATNLNIQ